MKNRHALWPAIIAHRVCRAMMERMLRDLRQAVRALLGQRGFTLTALATLALGIGANVAMFGIVYAMLLRPLPYPDSDAIVRIGEMVGPAARASLFLSNATMPRIQEEADSFEQVAGYRATEMQLAGSDGATATRLRGAEVSPSMFPLLRTRPHLGRFFIADEAWEGEDQVVVLSYGAWARRFGSDPGIVGAVLDLNGNPHTVVGVTAEDFYFPTPETEAWTPFVITPFTSPAPPEPGEEAQGAVVVFFNALGRLRAGVSPQQAATEVRTILQQGSTPFLRALARTGTSQGGSGAGDTPEIDAVVIPLREDLVAEYRPALLALTAATALVLLIACINVAGLLLARGVTRQRALAVCAALGAGRGRMVRQVLTESIVLSLSGGAIGLAVATAVLRAVPALVPGDIARLDEAGVDDVVLAFTLGLSVLVGLVFGAVPAFQWSRVPLLRTLNEGSLQSTGGFRLLRAGRTRAALATAQVALALVLLVGAGLLLRSFVELVTVDRGYDPANVVTALTWNPDLRLESGAVDAERMELIRSGGQSFAEPLLDAADRLTALPGVEAVGLSTGLPLVNNASGFASVHVEGRPPASDPAEMPFASVRVASPGYFDALRLRLRSGRFYTRRDRAGSPQVCVVNETFAREVFRGEPAVGQRIRFGHAEAGGEPWEVVGVVADMRYEGIAVTPSPAEVFVPTYQMAGVPTVFLHQFVAVRTTGDPLPAVPFLREAVAEAHPSATIDNVSTLAARLSAAVAQPRFYASIVGFFAALALFLAAFGLYGLLSYVVAQRRREIGVRMALGAQRGSIVALVVRQGAMLIAAGAVAGLLAAAASSRVLEGFLYGVSTGDRLTFAVAPLVLVAVALVACWLPARRATRIEPMNVLRVE
ncbi:MAG: ABC transporter permease [Acidobacteria bacterium]|nr:ABC transporter permease [Acidobacteriota bacterium]MYJ05728.1 ABC transporter permease [Acidobacteriota bacterium]